MVTRNLFDQKPSGSGEFCGRTRREFLWQSGGGFMSVALASMLGHGFFSSQTKAADGLSSFGAPRSLEEPHFRPRAKNVIFLYMYGGPSQIDTFDYKPALRGMDNKTVPVATKGRSGIRDVGRVVEPRWQFRRYGQSGQYVSTLFPHLSGCVDDIAFIKSMTADSPLHGSAMLQMNTGRILSGSPSMGSWINYGLGSVNENLPGFVVMLDPRGGPISGAKNWSSGYMPASLQGSVIRSTGTPILNLHPREGVSRELQRGVLDAIESYNRTHLETRSFNSNLASRIASYELAFRMQSEAPEATDVERESEKTQEMYGLRRPETAYFGRQCLIARRLVERGVRFVQLFSGGAHASSTWDAHDDIVSNHEARAMETDQPVAGLIRDLKQRGMLDETLIIWGGEFGRQPIAEYEKGTGRDHNSYGFTMWMAGGGVKSGQSIGETDELGNAAVRDPFHVKNLHATVLHLLGVDPNRLTYFHRGLEEKLVGPEEAEPIWPVIA